MWMYVPQEMRMISPATPLGTVPVSSATVISWNPDASNNRVVYIGLQYHSCDSHEEDPTLPSQDVLKLISTDADGSYTLTPTDFQGFLTRGYLRLDIGRGNASFIINQGQLYFVHAYTIADEILKLAP